MMKATLTTLALLLGTALAQAQALGPWTTAGDVLANGGTTQLSTAYDGSDAPGPLSASGAVDISALEAQAGVAPYALDLSGAEYATEGSLIHQSFSVLAGQTLSFDWSFSTLETQFQDRAFVVVNGQVSTLTTATGAISGHFSQLFGSAGTVSLAIGVIDTVDYLGTSTLTLSNMSLSPVPEPTSLALMAGGLGLVALRRRANRS